MANYGMESETLEFKKTTAELNSACVSICAMLNKHGVGTLYFGVKQNGEAVGQDVSEASLRDVSRAIHDFISPQIIPTVEKENVTDNLSLIRVEFNGSEQPYSAYGKYYIRTADEDRLIPPSELAKMFARSGNADKWEYETSDALISDVDSKRLRLFHEDAIKAGRMPNSRYSITGELKKLGLVNDDRLNKAGKMLFSKNNPLSLKMAVFATDDKMTFLDIKVEEGNIFGLLEVAESYILRNIRWRVEITGMDREEIPEIPAAVIREALANSFAHAVYGSRTTHEICIHPNMVTIYNPGSFASFYKPAEYVNKNLPSVIRNELIAKCLYLSKKIEKFGSGIQRMASLCTDANVKYKFVEEKGGFKLVLFRNNSVRDIPDVTSDVTLSETEKTVLALLHRNPMQTRAELAEKTSKTVRTIQRTLDSLKEKGFIERTGKKSEPNWILLK